MWFGQALSGWQRRTMRMCRDKNTGQNQALLPSSGPWSYIRTPCPLSAATSANQRKNRSDRSQSLVRTAWWACLQTSGPPGRVQAVSPSVCDSASTLCTPLFSDSTPATMREIVHIQAGQCGNQIGAKVRRGRQSRGTGSSLTSSVSVKLSVIVGFDSLIPEVKVFVSQSRRYVLYYSYKQI